MAWMAFPALRRGPGGLSAAVDSGLTLIVPGWWLALSYGGTVLLGGETA